MTTHVVREGQREGKKGIHVVHFGKNLAFGVRSGLVWGGSKKGPTALKGRESEREVVSHRKTTVMLRRKTIEKFGEVFPGNREIVRRARGGYHQGGVCEGEGGSLSLGRRTGGKWFNLEL